MLQMEWFHNFIVVISVVSVTSFVFGIIISLAPSCTGMKVSRIFPYTPPTWWPGQKEFFPKSGRLSLGNLPTPLHSLGRTNLCDVNGISFNMFVKRDDMSGGVEMGGNKIRKLNFLLADALAGGYDSVVTIGGEQSNHCRATAAAARMVGLDPHLILRTRKSYVDDNEMLGTTGNLLYDRFVGATIYTCTPGEYGRFGSNALLKKVCGDLERMGKVPYLINVGGSNGIGTWGYIDAIDELVSQITSYSQNVGEDSTNESLINIDHIVFACGSGGTAAGISCGVALAFSNERNLHLPQVHAIGVCDSPEYFYNEILNISRELGLFQQDSYDDAIAKLKSWVTIHQGRGLGYSINTKEELEFCKNFSLKTGIVIDPVYTGKALFHFATKVLPGKHFPKITSLLLHLFTRYIICWCK